MRAADGTNENYTKSKSYHDNVTLLNMASYVFLASLLGGHPYFHEVFYFREKLKSENN
jgi:hypothetical protein